MENIKYFVDLTHEFLLAYERNTEFFVRYVPKTDDWEDVSISFSDFRHDYDFKEISKEEATQKANGNLPEKAYKQYLMLINRNLGN